MKRIVVTLLFLIFNCPLLANNKIHQLQSQISTIKTQLSSAQQQQTNLQANLQTTEVKVGELTSQLQTTQQHLQKEQQQLILLTKQQREYQKQLSQQQILLKQQIRSIYIFNHQPYLKIILNQQDPQQMQRMLTYYHYINDKRINVIDQVNQTLNNINQTKQLTQHHSLQLIALKKQQEQEKIALEKNKIQREFVLRQINSEIANKNQQLKVLITNKIALEHLVDRLQRNKVYNYFARLGKFPWPTHGRILEHYDDAILHSQLHTTSVLIAAPLGQSVTTIAPGRVVYANWLSGYGLLIIIDHGDGLMSLYGRNQVLYKKLGEYVNRGEKIAGVGDSGGFQQPALYFAIRKNGQPVNPEQYCG